MIKPTLPRDQQRREVFDLQYFAGGSNLSCHTCSYFHSGLCELHHKQTDQQSEACSHYQGRQQI